MGLWTSTRTATIGGRYQLVISRRGPHGASVDVTSFRGAPTQLDGYSSGDPFGDATAQFTFPAITPFDDFTSPDLIGWLCHYADVDLYWVPALPYTDDYAAHQKVLNPLTNRADVVTPAYLRDGDGNVAGENRIKVWEGFIASMDFTGGSTDASLQISCQGALYQTDRYLQKPFFPSRPWPLEKLIQEVFSHRQKPNLRTRPLRIDWPDDWLLTIPKHDKDTLTLYTPIGKPGEKWSGYITRQTGSWDHALTGFIQDQLTVMITDRRSGTRPGNQWTVMQDRKAPGQHGRTPVLKVRGRHPVSVDFSVWYGVQGVEAQMSSDSTQSEDVIYGEGTNLDGTNWRNAVISSNGSRTDYMPLAASRDVFPPHKREFVTVDGQEFAWPFVSEAFTKFGSGFDQPAAVRSSEQQLNRDRDPGWTGTITLSIDPDEDLPRALIHAGMTMKLKGFAGSGARGVQMHIASVQHSPMSGTVELTVDTRYRDLLTVDEARSRSRDPLTPVKMLQVNRTSIMIEDIQAPWDYSAGSGFIPGGLTKFFAGKPTSSTFPYAGWARKNPPLHHPSYYVKVDANAPTTRGRWNSSLTRHASIPVLTSEKGSIIRSEFAVFDVRGNLLKIPFHVGIYDRYLTADAMPHEGSNFSAWRNNAFLTIDPATGNPFPPGSANAPDASVRVLWGGQIDGVMNRAGFSPGRESRGDNPTGLLVDESSWTYDNTSNPNYSPTLAKKGPDQTSSRTTEPVEALQLWVMFYCEHTEPVYFLGRLYRQNPGTS